MSDAGALWPGLRRQARFDVLTLGQNSLDEVHRGDEVIERTGGQVATTALASAKLGLRVAYAGAVGDDSAADRVLGPLLEADIDCSAVVRVAGGRTRRARILVDPQSGDRRVEPERDPSVRLRPADLDRAQIEAARALHVDAEDPDASAWAAAVARAAGIPVVLDVDRARPELEALLGQADFPIVSHEFAETSSRSSARDALRDLAARGGRLAVVTLGEQGAIALGAAQDPGEEAIVSPAFATRVVDTTGSGDAFRAGFLWALLQGASPEATLRAANAAGALACRAVGAQDSLPDRVELETLWRSRDERTGRTERTSET